MIYILRIEEGRSAHAGQADEVSDDQHGSREKHKALNACLNKKFLCDVLRQKRRAGAVAMNDTCNCGSDVDEFWCSADDLQSPLQTLQQAKHHIKIRFGRSEAVYSGQKPTLWALMITKFLRMMEKAYNDFNPSNDTSNGGLCLC